MKSIGRLFLICVILSFLISDCSLFENCATCSLVTEVDGIETSRTPGVLYCDENLEEKRNEPPTTILNRTTYWDCN